MHSPNNWVGCPGQRGCIFNGYKHKNNYKQTDLDLYKRDNNKSSQSGLTCTFRQAVIAHACHGHTLQLSVGESVFGNRLVVSNNPVRG